ncbi:hypothetical protein HDU96_006805 [Phlyctochytrium bullatum]|nr:hypothetical protein HDU96_006805 [Phlyctochytrium bullatum]
MNLSTPRASVTSKAPTEGLKKQNPIRAPLSVFIVAIVVLVAGLVGGLVGHLTIGDARATIDDITFQMRLAILEKTVDMVNTTLENAVAAMRAKVSDVTLFAWINERKREEEEFLKYPEMWVLKCVFFRGADERLMVLYSSTVPYGSVYGVKALPNFSPLVITPVLFKTNPLNPNIEWPPLSRNGGFVRGRPFFSPIVTVPSVKSLFIPLVWPVWRNRSLGDPGPPAESFWAVHMASIALDGLEAFLRTLKVSRTGIVAVVEGATGLMVSASAPNASYDADDVAKRFMATACPDPLVAAATRYMVDAYGNGTVAGIPDRGRYDFMFKALGDDVLVNAMWLGDESMGLRWLVMVIIPSNDFLGGIRTTITRTIVMVVCICLGAVALAILLSWAITAPLTKLVKAMVEATKFDFSALGQEYLSHRSHVREIGLLQGVFNEMLVNFANAIRANKSLTPVGAGPRKVSTAPFSQCSDGDSKTSHTETTSAHLGVRSQPKVSGHT